jgi:hypothetical protein
MNGRMRHMSMRLPALLALLLPFVLSTGCGVDKDIIDPAIEIPATRTVVVVPFRDEDYPNGFDSPRGCLLAEKITKLLKEKADFRVKSQEFVIELYQEGNPTQMTAKDVAEKTRADYVLMGNVAKWSLKDEGMYGGLLRGSAVIDVSLYETAPAAEERLKDTKDKEDLPMNGRGRLAFSGRRVTATFPHEYGMSKIGVYDSSEPEIEAGLTLSAANSVAWLLISHSRDEEKLSEGK